MFLPHKRAIHERSEREILLYEGANLGSSSYKREGNLCTSSYFAAEGRPNAERGSGGCLM